MGEKAWTIGIVGGSGSGKTSVAQELVRRIGSDSGGALLLDMDADYAPLEVVRARFAGRPINWDHPHAFDLELMASHLAALRRQEPIRKPVYDFSLSDRVGWEEPRPAAAVVVMQPILPYALAFAAGAMVFVVVEEVVPESQSAGHGDWATMGLIAGFTLMMILDVAFG